ncbi:MAG: hypothetical protein ACRC2T_02195, partial [Thermoguttaceae bacterium]
MPAKTHTTPSELNNGHRYSTPNGVLTFLMSVLLPIFNPDGIVVFFCDTFPRVSASTPHTGLPLFNPAGIVVLRAGASAPALNQL